MAWGRRKATPKCFEPGAARDSSRKWIRRPRRNRQPIPRQCRWSDLLPSRTHRSLGWVLVRVISKCFEPAERYSKLHKKGSTAPKTILIVPDIVPVEHNLSAFSCTALFTNGPECAALHFRAPNNQA